MRVLIRVGGVRIERQRSRICNHHNAINRDARVVLIGGHTIDFDHRIRAIKGQRPRRVARVGAGRRHVDIDGIEVLVVASVLRDRTQDNVAAVFVAVTVRRSRRAKTRIDVQRRVRVQSHNVRITHIEQSTRHIVDSTGKIDGAIDDNIRIVFTAVQTFVVDSEQC